MMTVCLAPRALFRLLTSGLRLDWLTRKVLFRVDNSGVRFLQFLWSPNSCFSAFLEDLAHLCDSDLNDLHHRNLDLIHLDCCKVCTVFLSLDLDSVVLQVTFKVDEQRVLSVTAREQNSQMQYQWLQNGQMMARTLAPTSYPEVHEQQTMYPAANAGISP